MKKMQQVLLLLLAGLMVLGLTGTAMAENDYKVMVNGQYVTFTDAQPQNVDGRIMVPFRAILETLGADVEWDQATKTVTAVKDDTEISFVIGEEAVNVKKGDQERVAVMDVVPFVSAEARTYVGTRFMAEAFDYPVGWDAEEKTAVIADFNELFADADEELALMQKCFKAPAEAQGTVKTTADFNLDAEIAGVDGEKPLSISMKGDLSGYSNDADMDADLQMKYAVEFKNLEGLDEQTMASLEALKNIEMQVKLNGKTGDMYMKSPLFASLGLDENTWVKSNVFDTYDQMGIPIRDLLKMKQNNNQASIREQLIQGFGKDMTVNSYQQVSFIYGMVKDLFGKDRFTVKENEDSSVEYTNTIQGKDLIAALMKNADFRELLTLLTTESEMQKAMKDVSITLSFTEKQNEIIKNTIDIKANTEIFNATVAVTSDKTNAGILIDLNVPEVVKANLTGSAKATRSSARINKDVPTGAMVVDVNEMMNMAMMADSIEVEEETVDEEAPAENTEAADKVAPAENTEAAA